jgi:hypothetical protein
MPRELGKCLDRRHARRRYLLRVRPADRGTRAAGNATGDLEIGSVVAALTRDELVRARVCGSEKADAELPSHDAALGLYVERLEVAALEDPLVRPRLRSKLSRALSRRGPNEYASFMMNSRTRGGRRVAAARRDP